MLAVHALGVEGEIVLNAFLRQDGGASGHAAHHGYPVGLGLRLLCHRSHGKPGQGNRPSFALRLDDNPSLLQPLHMEVNGGGRFQSQGRADLPDGRGVAIFVGKGQDIIIDFLLFSGQLSHYNGSFQQADLGYPRSALFYGPYYTTKLPSCQTNVPINL